MPNFAFYVALSMACYFSKREARASPDVVSVVKNTVEEFDAETDGGLVVTLRKTESLDFGTADFMGGDTC
jgi:hypothetical protein